MSSKLSLTSRYYNAAKLPSLYKLYVRLPPGMNKLSHLSELTRLAIDILERGNRTYVRPSLMSLKMQNKINTIKKAINKVMVQNRLKAATIIQHYFKTKREMKAFANTNRGKTVKNQVPNVTKLISAFRRQERGH